MNKELEKITKELTASKAVMEMMHMFSEVIEGYACKEVNEISLEFYRRTQEILDRVNGE